MAWSTPVESGAGRRVGTKRIRVLHALGQLNAGGVETWLVHVLRRIDRDRFGLDFVVSTDEVGSYDEEVRALGGKILACHHPQRPWVYARDLLRVLEENGPYDVVHAHLHHFSGLDLWAARRAGVPIRICQSHLNTSVTDRESNLARRGYLALGRRMILQNATHLVAVSDQAGLALYGKEGTLDPRYGLLRCGVDFGRFAPPIDREKLRRDLGIPVGAKVLGTIGRLAPQKNQSFLLDVLAELSRRDPSYHLVMVGDGPLRVSLRDHAHALGLSQKVIWTGARTDVEKLLPAFDVFVFPSAYEGLALAPLEAQAAGVPCVVSEAMPAESAIVDGLMRRVLLSAGVKGWAIEVQAALNARKPSPAVAFERMRESAFDISSSTRALEGLYASAP